MKNCIQIALFALFFTLSTSSIFAQKTMSMGSVVYDMKLDDSNPMASMMANTTMTLTFKESMMKTEVNLMGGMINMRIVMDNAAEKGVMIMSAPMMGKNMAVNLTKEDIAKQRAEQKVNQATPKIEYYKKSTKKIAGFKCYKAQATMAGVPEPVTLYVCEQIVPVGQSQIQQQLPGLKGFPLSYEIMTQGMKINIIAKEVSKNTPADSEFDMTIPEGFDIVTLEELGGLGGFGGFGM